MGKKQSRRGFGAIRKLPSGRYQASYAGPDTIRHKAAVTFETREDAEEWLGARRREIRSDEWQAPAKAKPLTFEEYAQRWLKNRTLKPRTRYHYSKMLDARILPTFANVPLKSITPDLVDDWYYRQGDKHPTAKAHAYGLLRTILGDAVQRRVITHNPCHIRGAGNTTRAKKIEPATLPELEIIVRKMPERLQLMTLLAAWCAMRFGELIELRRGDIDLKNGIVKIRRAAVHVEGELIVGTPKSDAGVRDVRIPPHLMPLVKAHLAADITEGRDGLLFPATNGGHLQPSTLYGKRATATRAGHGFYAAREAAGRPDLSFHGLRHTGATLAAQTGATLAELMGRLGHSTAGAAMRYQHASQDRDLVIAEALSAMTGYTADTK